MKVFVTETGYMGEKCYFIPANSARGASIKWNKAFPDDKRYSEDFEEVSDDKTNTYKFINRHY